MTDKPTIVLVYSAFADTSGCGNVITGLSAEGFQCYAPANQLRGIAADSDHVRSLLSTLSGPVVLAGHSYGGAVITNAGTGNPNGKALVVICAYAPDAGETLNQVNDLGETTTELSKHLVTRPYPGVPEGDADGYIDPAMFHQLFCADLDPELAAAMAVNPAGVAD